MLEDEDRCYRAIASRDPRFDGWFVTAVTSTRIYCRPSCPARTPRREHVRFFPTAAAAQRNGFRACKRCRPDASPGSPEWRRRGDVVARAVQLISEGAVDREGVAGLARRLGYSERHLHRLLRAELGAGPQALARAHRAQTARVLIETTSLPLTEVAFAAGFASTRQYNETVRAVFAATPTELRSRAAADRRRAQRGHRAHPQTPAGGGLVLRLPRRAPFAAREVFEHLARRAVPGLDAGSAVGHERTLRLPHGWGTVRLEPASDHVRCVLRLEDLRDLAAAVQGCRHLLDLDADPEAVDAALGCDEVLGPLVARRAGLRVTGSCDPFETAVRTVVAQQVSVVSARTATARLVDAFGAPVPAASEDDAVPRLLFPAPHTLAALDPGQLPVPRARADAVVALSRAVATGELVLDSSADPDALRHDLRRIPGIGPWTADVVALRGLGHPDVFPRGDVAASRALRALGGAADDTSRWSPWRSYALAHLWAHAAAAGGAAPPPCAPHPVPDHQETHR